MLPASAPRELAHRYPDDLDEVLLPCNVAVELNGFMPRRSKLVVGET